MEAVFVHVADLHFVRERVEDFGPVLDSFLADVDAQLSSRKKATPYLVVSGDIVFGGDEHRDYDELFARLDSRLNEIGIPRSRRICVPGNHDVSQKVVRSDLPTHDGWISQGLRESEFNDFIQKRPDQVTSKFKNYIDFQARFAAHGLTASGVAGAGWDLGEDIGVYCLNTAVMSLGGSSRSGASATDQKRLLIDTRSMQDWLRTTKMKHRILVMHHPCGWLSDWGDRELQIMLNKSFTASLSGHVHRQSASERFYRHRHVVECGAPPLFSTKQDLLGYSLVSVTSDTGFRHVDYRQWTPRHSFVTGVSFSDTDNGRVQFRGTGTSPTGTEASASSYDRTNRVLSKRFEDALISYPQQPRLWLEPTLSTVGETATDAARANTIVCGQFVEAPRSAVIHAPPQFGLTCVGYHIARLAWQLPTPRLWIRLDTLDLKPHAHSIAKAVKLELADLGASDDQIAGVLLDSWSTDEPSALRIVERVCELFPDKPVVILHTMTAGSLIPLSPSSECTRDFHHLYLWSLTRGGVRELVRTYIDSAPMGDDDDSVTARLASDFRALNLHRTPLNCITLMKVHGADFDESPVNRTEVIKRVLFLLFDVGYAPDYKVRPDMKDCEYVLGYFCEQLIRNGETVFSREHFIEVTKRLCREQYIDLDVEVVFDVLVRNHILIRRGAELFGFRFSYWLYYFCAHRMHNNDDFAKHMMKDRAYARFPEVMEFYTGIDRRRADAIRALITDVRASRQHLQAKTGLPAGIDLYAMARWEPDRAAIEEMDRELREGIRESNLPVSVKDKVADSRYDRSRPYHQEIRLIMPDWSLPALMQTLRAASRALRNSDYVDPRLKEELLCEIGESWVELCRVLWLIAPLLAERGAAAYDGATFLLDESFTDKAEERFWQVLSALPRNIINWSEDDLLSQKMGPLLLQKLKSEAPGLSRHLLALLVLRNRPRGWQAVVQQYIVDCSKNSYYLLDLGNDLRNEYRCSYAKPRVLDDIAFLIKLVAAKHAGLGSTSPAKVQRVPDSVLPRREVDDA
ncbi:MAG: metallophosphoesterase [Planctomycetes bacterium]|nr:metallophosphoesterase [Planctomycetota bacterium]